MGVQDELPENTIKQLGSLFGGGGAEADAKKAAARAEASRAAAETATQNMKTNFATDLRQENVGTVVAAGSASALSTSEDDLKKKKQATSTLSSQLGINL